MEKQIRKQKNRLKAASGRRGAWISGGTALALFAYLFLSVPEAAAQTEAPAVSDVTAMTEAPAAGDVAVMTFAGDDASLSGQIRDSVITEIGNQEGFNPRPLDAAGAVPDEPPDPALLEGAPFVLTGEYYFDDEDSQHLQIWLWDSESGALVYTDELVAYDLEEAKGYIPALVSWVFSKAEVEKEAAEEEAPEEELAEEELPEEEPAGEETAEEELPEEEEAEKGRAWLYLGIEAGAAFNLYDVRVSVTYDGSTGQGPGVNAGITAGFMPLPFLGLWTGAAFTSEFFQLIGISPAGVHAAGKYRAMSLRVPLLLGVSFAVNGFEFALKPGAYYNLPLGKIQTPDGEADYSVPPFGISVGVELGHSLGPGILFGGIRYNRDLGVTIASDIGLQYVRQEAVLFLGYRWGIGKRNQ
jgi:hypothetical protein